LDTKLSFLLRYVFCLSHRNFKQLRTFAEIERIMKPADMSVLSQGEGSQIPNTPNEQENTF
jgi:hypothetical protein